MVQLSKAMSVLEEVQTKRIVEIQKALNHYPNRPKLNQKNKFSRRNLDNRCNS